MSSQAGQASEGVLHVPYVYRRPASTHYIGLQDSDSDSDFRFESDLELAGDDAESDLSLGGTPRTQKLALAYGVSTLSSRTPTPKRLAVMHRPGLPTVPEVDPKASLQGGIGWSPGDAPLQVNLNGWKPPPPPDMDVWYFNPATALNSPNAIAGSTPEPRPPPAAALTRAQQQPERLLPVPWPHPGPNASREAPGVSEGPPEGAPRPPEPHGRAPEAQGTDEAAQNRLLAAARARQVLQLERKVSALTERLGQAERASTEVANQGAAESYALKDRLEAAEAAAKASELRCTEASRERDELKESCRRVEAQLSEAREDAAELQERVHGLEARLSEARNTGDGRQAKRQEAELRRMREEGERVRADVEERLAGERRRAQGLEEELQRLRGAQEAASGAAAAEEEARRLRAELEEARARLEEAEGRAQRLSEDFAARRSKEEAAAQAALRAKEVANLLGIVESDEEEEEETDRGRGPREESQLPLPRALCSAGVQTERQASPGSRAKDELLGFARREVAKLKEANKRLADARDESSAALEAARRELEQRLQASTEACSKAWSGRASEIEGRLEALQERLRAAEPHVKAAKDLRVQLQAAKMQASLSSTTADALSAELSEAMREAAELREHKEAAERLHEEELEQLRQIAESDAAASGMEAFSRATATARAAAAVAEAKLAELTAEAETLRAQVTAAQAPVGGPREEEEQQQQEARDEGGAGVLPDTVLHCSVAVQADAESSDAGPVSTAAAETQTEKKGGEEHHEEGAPAAPAAAAVGGCGRRPSQCVVASQTELRLGVGAVYGLGLPWGGGNGVVGACSSPLHRWLEQQVRAPSPGGAPSREVSDSAASSLPVHASKAGRRTGRDASHRSWAKPRQLEPLPEAAPGGGQNRRGPEGMRRKGQRGKENRGGNGAEDNREATGHKAHAGSPSPLGPKGGEDSDEDLCRVCLSPPGNQAPAQREAEGGAGEGGPRRRHAWRQSSSAAEAVESVSSVKGPAEIWRRPELLRQAAAPSMASRTRLRSSAGSHRRSYGASTGAGMESHLMAAALEDDPSDVLRKSQMHRDRSLAQEAMAREALLRLGVPAPSATAQQHLDACPEDAPLLRQPSSKASSGVPALLALRAGAPSSGGSALAPAASAPGAVVNDRYRGQQQDPVSPLPGSNADCAALPELLVSADATPAAARGGPGPWKSPNLPLQPCGGSP